MLKLKNYYKKHKPWLLVFLLFSLFFAFSIFIRLGQYKEDINVENLDASYHIIATVDALKSENIRSTKLLPVVSFSGELNKHIPWGATVEGKGGNLVYTSFPQGGFIAPYIYFSITNIEPTIYSLMIFNFGINFLTGLLLLILLYLIAREVGISKRHSKLAALAISVTYIFSIETLYSQGIVYWGQSLFQAVLIAQLILVYLIFKRGYVSIVTGSILTILCVIAPFIEWTGLLSNFGIIVLASIVYYKTRKKYSLYVGCAVVAATILGILLFVVPMVYSLGAQSFIEALKSRFLARSAGSTELPTPWGALVFGYVESFGPIIYSTLILILVAMFRTATRLKFLTMIRRISGYLLILIFAMFENVIMKQHATTYSFDRLKLFLLLAILLVCLYSAFGKRLRYVFYGVILVCLGINVLIFSSNSRVLTQPDIYSNIEMTASIGKENMIVATNGPVRGYITSTLKRGVYENIATASHLKAVADIRQVPNATFLLGNSFDNAVYKWNKTVTYDYKKNTMLIKFRNDACSYNYYYISSNLLPDTFKVSRVYDPNTGQDINTTLTSTGTTKIKANKSYARYNDCFDSVMLEIRN